MMGLFVLAILIKGSNHSCFAGEKGQITYSGHYNVGFQILKMSSSQEKPLVIAVWYPTEQKPTPMKYVLIEKELEADVAKNAVPLKGPFPLVIMSHGGGVSAACMAVYAEELAASGFVVAGPDHSDEFIACRSDRKLDVSVRDWLKWAHQTSTRIGGKQKASKFEHRAPEITTTIDFLLELDVDSKSPFYGVIDSKNIGMLGVSFGAWTTVAVSGAIPFYHDKRIKAAIPIAGNPGMFGRGTDISRIKIPVMIILGEEETMVLLDRQSPKRTERMKLIYELANPPKFLIGVKGAKHLNFGGAGTFNAKMGRAFSTREVRSSDPVTGVVNKYCIAFFRRYLMGDSNPEKMLTESDPRLFLFKADLDGKEDSE